MSLEELKKIALEVRSRYAGMEISKYGREWTDEEIALGFVGDVGDLMKLVLAQNGVRHIDDYRDKLAHELADCLWCIFVLSDNYQIDLEKAFIETMSNIEQSIGKTA